ncbi:MAG: glycerol-3-phosphate acyltransferase [Ruminococcaceae bacterium]|nr:glycerol-3-phosphate acyltransferase [Oscillospiraceae bacterium]
MPLVLKVILCILFGYVIGTINPTYIIGRLRGFDIRRRGSGNAGASNAIIIMGKAVGILSAIFDILKASAVMWLAPVIFADLPFAAEIAGACAIAGHIFPFHMGFKGGKGLACLGGVLLAIDPRLFLIVLTAEIVLVLIVDYICIVPITASILTPFLYVFFGKNYLDLLWRAEGGWWGAAILGVASLIILSRHIQNIKRIRNGTELHFSYLWKKDKAQTDELARIGKTLEDKNIDSK